MEIMGDSQVILLARLIHEQDKRGLNLFLEDTIQRIGETNYDFWFIDQVMI